jgi:hypothetical protein
VAPSCTYRCRTPLGGSARNRKQANPGVIFGPASRRARSLHSTGRQHHCSATCDRFARSTLDVRVRSIPRSRSLS